MKTRVLYCLMLIASATSVHAKEEEDVTKENHTITNTTDSRFFEYKTGFDKCSFKSFSKLSTARPSNYHKQGLISYKLKLQ